MGLFSWLGDRIKDTYDSGKKFVQEKAKQVTEFVEKTFNDIKDKFTKKSKETGKTEAYDEDRSTLSQTAVISEILASYSLGIQSQADLIEKNCLEESQRYFDSLISELNDSDAGFNTGSIVAALGDVKSKINGFLKNHVAKRLSLDDSECLKVLRMNAGKEKESAMKSFGDHVMSEALELLSAQICEIVEKQNVKVKDHLEDILEQKEKEYSSMFKQYNTIAEESDNNLTSTEKMKVTPMLVIGIAEVILAELSE